MTAKLATKTLTPTETFHGMEVLNLRVDDPLPPVTKPTRYAVRVYPDLARYLLTFNHDDNRHARDRKYRSFAADMKSGYWMFAPTSIVFDITGTLNDGQNRLLAVIESGETVWMVIDFGWPVGIIRAIDRGTTRTTADMLKIGRVPNAAAISSSVSLVWQYERLVGLTRSLAGFDVPSSMQTEAIYLADAARWDKAVTRGGTIYKKLDNGASQKFWSALFYMADVADSEGADLFYNELLDGSGAPGSATRALADHFRRRPVSVTRTGDSREPLEIMVRGWNAWLLGKPLAFPKYSGFALSRMRE